MPGQSDRDRLLAEYFELRYLIGRAYNVPSTTLLRYQEVIILLEPLTTERERETLYLQYRSNRTAGLSSSLRMSPPTLTTLEDMTVPEDVNLDSVLKERHLTQDERRLFHKPKSDWREGGKGEECRNACTLDCSDLVTT